MLEWKPPQAKWFVNGTLNVSVNCVDRHARGPNRNKAAIIWEGEPGERRTLTYWDLSIKHVIIRGHRIGTMEVESALVDHTRVAESAVVGRPHEIKGQAISAFVTLKEGSQPSDTLS